MASAVIPLPLTEPLGFAICLLCGFRRDKKELSDIVCPVSTRAPQIFYDKKQIPQDVIYNS